MRSHRASFSGRQAPRAGGGQPELSKPPDCVAERDETLPMQLRNLALAIGLADLVQRDELVVAQWRRMIRHDAISSVQTLKLVRVFGPKVCVIGTSQASRPCPIRMRPIRGTLLRGSKVCQRPPMKASSQPAKSPTAQGWGVPISLRYPVQERAGMF